MHACSDAEALLWQLCGRWLRLLLRHILMLYMTYYSPCMAVGSFTSNRKYLWLSVHYINHMIVTSTHATTMSVLTQLTMIETAIKVHLAMLGSACHSSTHILWRNAWRCLQSLHCGSRLTLVSCHHPKNPAVYCCMQVSEGGWCAGHVYDSHGKCVVNRVHAVMPIL